MTALPSRHRQLHLDILRELGCVLERGARVLDYGCGDGQMVREYREAGFDAHGCDINLKTPTNHLRPVDPVKGIIPYGDEMFDFVFSDQVIEHVQDHDRAFAEISRVMKPGAVGLHIFPSKLKPIESHVRVPFAGLIQQRWWLRLWAQLGVRNSFQREESAADATRLNWEYLHSRTNYLSRSKFMEMAARHFSEFAFVEPLLIKHGYGGARRLNSLMGIFPFVAPLYATFYSRALFVKKSA